MSATRQLAKLCVVLRHSIKTAMVADIKPHQKRRKTMIRHNHKKIFIRSDDIINYLRAKARGYVTVWSGNQCVCMEKLKGARA